MSEEFEASLVFEQLPRRGLVGAAWDVMRDGAKVATVTHRWVSRPAYRIDWPTGGTMDVGTRDEVLAAIEAKEQA